MILMITALLGAAAPAFAAGDNAVEEGCVKIEGSDIGVEEITATVDGVTVTFTDWLQKTGEPGEYVGFTYEIEGGTFHEFTVKQGKDTVTVYLNGATTGIWKNEAGADGESLAKATSYVMFCGADHVVMPTTTIGTPTTTTTSIPPPPG